MPVLLRRISLFCLTLLLFSRTALAQEEIVPCQAMNPAPCEAPAAESPVVATIDHDTVHLSDLDQPTRERLAGLDAAVANARTAVVRQAIDTKLIELEAARLHRKASELAYAETVAKVHPPTDAEVRAEIKKRPDRYKRGEEDHDWAAAILLDEKIEAARSAFITALETRYPVKLVTSLQSESLAPDSVLATIGGHPLVASEIDLALGTASADERIDALQLEKDAVERAIDEKLERAEAARRNISVDALRKSEIDDKVASPTQEELHAFWEQRKPRFGNDYEKAKAQVEAAFKSSRVDAAKNSFRTALRNGHAITSLIVVPTRPAQRIVVSGAAVRGSADSHVTLVEYGDFQCPPCGRMWPIVEEALRPYGARVRYAFRQYPFSFHPFAWKAAEASLAAGAQGKFFQYANLLYTHQSALDIASLKKYAKDAGLDAARFARDLDSGRFGADVLAQKREGTSVGVRGTPAFFLNGNRLGFDAFSVEGMRRAIDKALGEEGEAKAKR